MQVSRRSLATAALLSGLNISVGCVNLPAPRQKLGIQLYMLGPDAAADVPAAFRAVADLGFEEIELPARSGPALLEMRQSLASAGLSCPSFHAPTRAFPPATLSLEDIPGVVEVAHALGARYVVVPFTPLPTIPEFPPGEDFRVVMQCATRAVTRDQWATIAANLNVKARELNRAGLRLAYHNHNLEFLPLGEGTILDFLIENTDPDLVDLELDVGWVAAAGLDPAAFIARHAARVKLLHVKDVADVSPNTNLALNPADVGAGRIDWTAVLGAAKAAGVRHYFVEQEPPYTRRPLESARSAYAFLRPLL